MTHIPDDADLKRLVLTTARILRRYHAHIADLDTKGVSYPEEMRALDEALAPFDPVQAEPGKAADEGQRIVARLPLDGHWEVWRLDSEVLVLFDASGTYASIAIRPAPEAWFVGQHGRAGNKVEFWPTDG